MSIKVAQKITIWTPFQKMSKNVGDLGKLIVAQSGHTDRNQQINLTSLLFRPNYSIDFVYFDSAFNRL